MQHKNIKEINSVQGDIGGVFIRTHQHFIWNQNLLVAEAPLSHLVNIGQFANIRVVTYPNYHCKIRSRKDI